MHTLTKVVVLWRILKSDLIWKKKNKKKTLDTGTETHSGFILKHYYLDPVLLKCISSKRYKLYRIWGIKYRNSFNTIERYVRFLQPAISLRLFKVLSCLFPLTLSLTNEPHRQMVERPWTAPEFSA